jgi:hypothetical protein
MKYYRDTRAKGRMTQHQMDLIATGMLRILAEGGRATRAISITNGVRIRTTGTRTT